MKPEKIHISSKKIFPILSVISLGILLFFVLKPEYFPIRKNKSDLEKNFSPNREITVLKYLIAIFLIIEITDKLLLTYIFNSTNHNMHNIQTQINTLVELTPQNQQYKSEQENTIKDIQKSINDLKTFVNQSHNDSTQSIITFQKKSDTNQKNFDTFKTQISDLTLRMNNVYKFTHDLQNAYNNNFSNVNTQNSIQKTAILSLQSQLHSVVNHLNSIINNFNNTIKTNSIPTYNLTLLPIAFSDIPVDSFNDNLNSSKMVFNNSEKQTVNSVDASNIELTALISNCQNLLSKLENKFFTNIKTSLSNFQQEIFDTSEETKQLSEVLTQIAGKEIVIPETINSTFIDDIQKETKKENSPELLSQSYQLLQRLLEKKLLYDLNKRLTTPLTNKQKNIFKKRLNKVISNKDKNIIKQKKEIEDKLKEYNELQTKNFPLPEQKLFLEFFKQKNDILNKLYS